jgi:hypothetical protein
VDDALSCKYVLLSILDARFLRFEHIKELYKDDSDFATIYDAWYFRLDGNLFKENCLCPIEFMRELLVREAHGAG